MQLVHNKDSKLQWINNKAYQQSQEKIFMKKTEIHHKNLQVHHIQGKNQNPNYSIHYKVTDYN